MRKSSVFGLSPLLTATELLEVGPDSVEEDEEEDEGFPPAFDEGLTCPEVPPPDLTGLELAEVTL